jgi:hypothetical protein
MDSTENEQNEDDIENLMQEIFGVFRNTIRNEFMNIPFLYITNSQMSLISNEAKRLAEENITQYFQEELNVELMELIHTHYIYDFCCENDSVFIKYIYNLLFNEYGLNILKYIYTFYIFYAEDKIEEAKKILLQILSDQYKDDIIQHFISNRQNNNFEDDIKVVLDEDTFEKLETLKITEKVDDNCAICLIPFEIEDEIIKLKCNHIFHKDCIKTQLCNYSSKCPNCKTEIEGGKPIL